MTESIRKVLASGASGLIGSNLVRALQADRIQTVELARKNNSPQAGQVQPGQVRPGQIVWDTAAPQPVTDPAALEGAEAAIHLSGANLASHRWTESYKKEIADSRIDSTRALVRVFRGLKQPPGTLLCASAVGIYGDRGDEPLSEASKPGAGFLPELCTVWEAEADAAIELGIRVVHLRFGVVLSAEGGALKQMLPLFRLGAGGRLGSGRQWMSWIALPDLISAIRFLIETTSVAGPVNLTTPNPVTNSEFTHTLGRVVHRPAVLPAPAFALRLALGQMSDDALLSSARAIPERLLQSGFRFEYPELEPALRAVL